MSIRPSRWRLAPAAVVALLLLAIAAGCQRVTVQESQEDRVECRSPFHGDPMPTKDNPVPTAIMRCNDP